MVEKTIKFLRIQQVVQSLVGGGGSWMNLMKNEARGFEAD